MSDDLTPTMRLRWYCEARDNLDAPTTPETLQQWFAATDGTGEWRDVPLEVRPLCKPSS